MLYFIVRTSITSWKLFPSHTLHNKKFIQYGEKNGHFLEQIVWLSLQIKYDFLKEDLILFSITPFGVLVS